MRWICAFLLFVGGSAQAQMPRVGAVEYYGLDRVTREAVARALQLAPGDTVVIETFPAIQARVAAVPGVSVARVQPVCCENGRTTIYVGIAERDSPLQPFRAAPTGAVRLPDDIVRAGADFDAAFTAAITRGEFGEDQTQGHSLMNDSASRAVQRRFIALATRDRARLSDVLRNSSSTRDRTLAAQVIAYAADKRDVVDDLAYGMRDASSDVRNAALRALWLIAEFGRREPARGIRVAPDPFVEMLTSIEWSDRNKASLALVALSASRDSVLLGLMRTRALPALADMARWSAPGHSLAGYMLLGRVAGMSDSAIGAAIEKKDAEGLIRAAAGPQTQDSVYASAALREFIARAAVSNAAVPAEVDRYGVRIESEFDYVLRRGDGIESVMYAEQIRSEFAWLRGSPSTRNVLTSRVEARPEIALALANSEFPGTWVMPALYGERLRIEQWGRLNEPPRAARARRSRDTTVTVHPLAQDRDDIYRFTGGDTLITIHVRDRDVPIARVFVEPRIQPRDTNTRVFSGHIDFDAARHEIVRMTGRFLTIPNATSDFSIDGPTPITVALYVDLESAEYDGRIWLPITQRFEVQVGIPLFTDSRAIVRVVSSFHDYVFNGDSVVPHATEWSAPIGRLTESARADNFQSVAPNVWRSFGPPRVEVRARTFGELFRFNRVEGAFSGLAGQVRFRDLSPPAFRELTIGAAAGYAWSERTVRGRVSGLWRTGAWEPSIELARELAVTNDFRDAFSQGGSFTALIGSRDDYDYVDRRSGTAAVSRPLGSRDVVLRLEAGAGNDRFSRARWEKSPMFADDSGFRPNRGVDEGNYVRTAATLTLNPRVHGLGVARGVGARLSYERGNGDLEWQRVEARFVTRYRIGPFVVSSKLEGGVLLGDSVPPQQLFEIGGTQHLPGYDYKQFAGDRAAIAQAKVQYFFGVWRTPIRFLDQFALPAPEPALFVSAQSGWTGALGAGTRASMTRLRPDGAAPLTTERARTTVAFGVEFFAGFVRLGLARAVDHRDAWRWSGWQY